ncbi:MAG: hypothetical protein WDA20_06140 [Desulfuromonadales bacterium]
MNYKSLSRLPLLSMKIFGGLALLMGCIGCSAAKPEKTVEAVFFPAPPNPPKVQFLKSISNSKDVERKSTEFAIFSLAGSKKDEVVKKINKPYGVSYANGKIYVCDLQGPNIVIIDLNNHSFEYFKGNKGYGKLKKPVNLSIDKQGNMYVADSMRKEVLVYDATGNFLKVVGTGQVAKPADVLADEEHVYVLDLADNAIKIFAKKDDRLVGSIGKTEGSRQGLSIPTNFAMDADGFLYVTNVGTGSVVKLDKDGHILDQFGRIGDAFGEFTRPKGIAVDGQGRISIVDAGHQNVQIFSKNKRLLMFFGDPPIPAGGMNLPAGIALTTDNLDYFQTLAAPGFILEQIVFVTNQMGPDKVSIYGLGHMTGMENTAAIEEETRTSSEPAKENH